MTKKPISLPKTSSSTELLAKRVASLVADPYLFAKYCAYTVDESDVDNPSKPYPAHIEYLQALIKNWVKHPFNVVEKSRGVMASWTMCVLHLHLAFTGPYRKVFIIAKDFKFAEQLRLQMLGIYERIPEDVWPAALRPKVHTREGEIIFIFNKDGNHDGAENSRILTMPSGEDVLRGFSGTAIWMDECDFHPSFENTFKASKSTARNKGRITLTSTYTSVSDMTEQPLFWRIIDDIGETFFEADAAAPTSIFSLDPDTGELLTQKGAAPK